MEALARKVTKARVRTGLKTRLFFGMMRMMIKSYDDTSADRQYWKENGWFGKARPWNER